MEWIFKLPIWLQIPLKVLLPFLTILTGFILIASDAVLVRLYLLDFRNTNGFIFGLLFLITVSLELVYLLAFIYYKFIKAIIIRRSLMKSIDNLSDDEKGLIIELYSHEGYSAMLDFQNPITQILIGKRYISVGSSQQVALNIFTNQMPIKVRLETHIIKFFDYVYNRMERMKKRLQRKLENCKKEKQSEKLQEKINDLNNGLKQLGGSR